MYRRFYLFSKFSLF